MAAPDDPIVFLPEAEAHGELVSLIERAFGMAAGAEGATPRRNAVNALKVSLEQRNRTISGYAREVYDAPIEADTQTPLPVWLARVKGVNNAGS